MRLRALTWNIHKGIGGVDRKYRPDRVIEVIGHYAPDIVFLQEVDEGCRRSRHDCQVDLVGDALDYPYRAYEANVKLLRGGQYGNAILSRWPLDDIENLDLTIKPKKRRSALTATAHVRTGGHERSLLLANMHLGLSGFERGVQLKRLLDSRSLKHHRVSTPFLLGGDFNDVWGTLGPKFLLPAGFRRVGSRLNTYPASLPVRPLDGLYVRGDVDPERGYRSRMRLAREASDHLPLFAEFRIRI